MRRAWFALALGWLALGVLLAVGLYLEREEIEARERQRLAHQARTIQINLGRQLDAVPRRGLPEGPVRKHLTQRVAHVEGLARGPRLLEEGLHLFRVAAQ